jgi:hypothetical protein
MNDAVQIRRRSGAPRANHFRFQPSFPPPPPAHRPSLKISNRESLRRVRAVNRLCDCGATDSALRNIDRPTGGPNLRISNRESLRRVRADDSARRNDGDFPVTRTKQTLRDHSNREFETLFQVTASTRRGRPFVPFSDAPPGFLHRAKPRGRPSFRPSFVPPSPLRRRQPAVPTSDYQPQNPNLHRAKRARHRNAHPPFL